MRLYQGEAEPATLLHTQEPQESEVQAQNSKGGQLGDIPTQVSLSCQDPQTQFYRQTCLAGDFTGPEAGGLGPGASTVQPVGRGPTTPHAQRLLFTSGLRVLPLLSPL